MFFLSVFSSVTELRNVSCYIQPEDKTICENENTEYYFSVLNAGQYQWQANSGNGFTDINNNETYSGTNTNTLTVTNANADMDGYLFRCTVIKNNLSISSNPVSLTVNQLIEANAGNNDSICNSTAYQLSGNNPSQGSGIWTVSDSNVTFNNENLYNATASNLSLGKTTFSWTITNEDGINEVWKIQGIKEFPDAKIFVYNRWGKLIRQYNSYDDSWDGTDNGRKLSPVIFFYIIEIEKFGIFKGTVTIFR